MLKIIRSNFTEVGHRFDYELENGAKLHASEWNGEVYTAKESGQEVRYMPVEKPIGIDGETGEPEQWETIGFERF